MQGLVTEQGNEPSLCIAGLRLREKAFQVELISTTTDEALACILYPMCAVLS